MRACVGVRGRARACVGEAVPQTMTEGVTVLVLLKVPLGQSSVPSNQPSTNAKEIHGT